MMSIAEPNIVLDNFSSREPAQSPNALEKRRLQADLPPDQAHHPGA
jgi:hypothetical protein